MRIAICLHGKIGGEHWKSEKLEYHSLEGYYEIKKNILDVYQKVDVFIHCWKDSEEKTERILNLYRPTRCKSEKQIYFSELINKYKKHAHPRLPQLIQNISSNWYSFYQSDLLRQEYEQENNFEYDCVIHSRFDVKFINFININNYNLNKFHVLDCHQSVQPLKYKNSFIDYFFFSNSSNMKKFSNLFNDLDLCFNSSVKNNRGILNFFNHYVSGFYARHLKLNIQMLNKSDIHVIIYRNSINSEP